MEGLLSRGPTSSSYFITRSYSFFVIHMAQVGDAEVSWEFDQPEPFHLGRGEEGRRVQEELEAGDW